VHFFLWHGFDTANKIEVLLEVFSLEARRIPAVIVGRKIFEAFDLAGEKAAAKRAVGNEAIPNSRVSPGFHLQDRAPERILRWQRGESDALCARAEWCWPMPRTIRGSELCPLSTSSPIAPTVSFDWDTGIERCWYTSQFFPRPGVSTAIARFAHIFRAALTRAQRIGLLSRTIRIWWREKTLVRLSLMAIPTNIFIVAVTVDVRVSRNVMPEFDGAMNCGDGLLVVTVHRIPTSPCSPGPLQKRADRFSR